MLLITSKWGDNQTFKMIPVTPEAPFNEVIFDPEQKVLAIVGKEKKQTFHMLPKLDDTGRLMPLKNKRVDGKDYAEERRLVETYYEYFIEDQQEITDFIKHFALNAGSFDFGQYVTEAFTAPIESPVTM
jgi:hypothetical protein